MKRINLGEMSKKEIKELLEKVANPPTNYFYMGSEDFLSRATPYAKELYESGEREFESHYGDDASIEPKRCIYIMDDSIYNGFYLVGKRKEELTKEEFSAGWHPHIILNTSNGSKNEI